MEVKRLVGRRVRVLLAQCQPDHRHKDGGGHLGPCGKLLLRLDDGTDVPIELGWVISVTEV
jgi:hypothetical protein